jgi:hypothetical protein
VAHDDGFGPAGWSAVAFALGCVALVCWIAFAVLLGDENLQPSATPWLWMAGAVSLTVFSAACAVLSALKAMEERLAADAS